MKTENQIGGKNFLIKKKFYMNETKEIPKKIYLQWFDEYGDENGEVCWCEDKINDNDLTYVLKQSNRFYRGFLVGCLASLAIMALGLIVGAYLAGFFNQSVPLVPILPASFL
jgi:hypothetical protein